MHLSEDHSSKASRIQNCVFAMIELFTFRPLLTDGTIKLHMMNALIQDIYRSKKKIHNPSCGRKRRAYDHSMDYEFFVSDKGKVHIPKK